MIEGLICTIPGTKVIELCRAHAADLSTKADRLDASDEEVAKVAAANQLSSSNILLPRDRAKQLRNDARELFFIADHLDPQETYRLSRSDLAHMGVLTSRY